MDALTQALSWLSRGVAVIPCRQDKKPAFRWKQYENQLPTETQVRDWLKAYPNYGVLVGWQNLTVIDFDRQDAYFAWRKWATAQGGIPEIVACCGYAVVTGRGVHVYVTTLDQVNAHFDGGDVKQSGYVLGAGSIHPSGVLYQALDDTAPVLPVEDLASVFPAITRPQTQREAPHPILGPNSGPLPPSIRPCAPQVTDPWDVASDVLSGRELLDLAKHSVPIWEILGVKLEYQSSPTHWMARCPKHDDQSPSLSVDVVSNRASCLARTCTGLHGWSAVDAAMWWLGTSDYMAAARWLLGR